jgi:Cu/Zn superoxide dismutase
MNRRLLATAAIALAMTAWRPTPAQAAVVQMYSRLDVLQEVPPPTGSTAWGHAEITVDTAANTLAYHIAYSGLSSAEIGAHIHGPGAPGEVAFAFLTFLPTSNPKDGVWNYPEEDEAMILGGLTYINIHTVNNQTGEIRGQIVNSVPLLGPQQLLLIALSLLVAGALFAPRALTERSA